MTHNWDIYLIESLAPLHMYAMNYGVQNIANVGIATHCNYCHISKIGSKIKTSSGSCIPKVICQLSVCLLSEELRIRDHVRHKDFEELVPPSKLPTVWLILQ